MRIYEKGITLIGLLFTIFSIVVVGLIVIQVVPVYIENYEIKQSMNALANVDANKLSIDSMSNISILKNDLVSQLGINSVVMEPTAIKVSSTAPGTYAIHVNYTVVKSLIGNVSLMFVFNEYKEVTVGPK